MLSQHIRFGSVMILLGVLPSILLLIMLLAESLVPELVESIGWATFSLCLLDNVNWAVYFRFFYVKGNRCERMKTWYGSTFQAWCYCVGISQLFLLGWLTAAEAPFSSYGISSSVIKGFSIVFAHVCVTRGLFRKDEGNADESTASLTASASAGIF